MPETIILRDQLIYFVGLITLSIVGFLLLCMLGVWVAELWSGRGGSNALDAD